MGIDGFSPQWMDRFLRAGKLPATDRIRRSGSTVPLVSTLPATTPVAWATITTGAPPATTGIEGFLVHQPGDLLDQRVSGCYSYRCRSQTLWDAAATAGKRACVVKFPGSYPSETAGFRLDGAAGWGGLKCLHETASRAVVSSDPAASDFALTPTDTVWIGEEGLPSPVRGRWVWTIPSLWGGRGVGLHVAVRGDGRRAVVDVADQPDRARILASVFEGAWSPPITVGATGRRGEAQVSFRLKVVAASNEPPAVRLLHTALHERHGHSVPLDRWAQLQAAVGPIEEQTEPSLFLQGHIDLETQFELFELNGTWLRDACRALLDQEPWDLFLVHIHVVDWAHHLLQGAVDPRHPDFDEATAPRYEDELLRAYRIADELVDAVVGATGPGTDVLVLGDHGQDLCHTTLRTNEWLAEQGLLRWADGGTTVDWSTTRAYAAGNYVHLNVLGREPTGVLLPGEVEGTTERIVGGLLQLDDPATGERPVLVAAPKTHFESLGADGVGVGDVVFCLRSGYHANNGRGPVLAPTRALHEFTSGHDHFWPLDPRIYTTLYASGPQIRRSDSLARARHVADVAPSVAALLGLDPPAHSTGSVMAEVLNLELDTPVSVSRHRSSERGPTAAGVI